MRAFVYYRHYIHCRLRDWRFIGFILLSLSAVCAYLVSGSVQLEQSGDSWRPIDTERVRRLLESGELSGKEAQWFHPTRPDERSGSSGAR